MCCSSSSGVLLPLSLLQLWRLEARATRRKKKKSLGYEKGRRGAFVVAEPKKREQSGRVTCVHVQWHIVPSARPLVHIRHVAAPEEK